MRDCPSEEELAGFLAGACGADQAGQIEAHVARCAACTAWVTEATGDDDLLKSLQRAMNGGSSDVTRVADSGSTGTFGEPVGAVEPDAIEGYEIEEEIGRGGMGVVYRAVQRSTKRRVALKVLLAGPFASPSAKRRFEREVELAAQLDHPGIVTILESGISKGRHYFAMNYVQGQRSDAFLAGRNWTIEQKLRLFAEIARAVNYAHQRGVIHRDLKPSNILVDDQGRPHVLDFGLAKLTEGPIMDDRTRMQLSVTGQVMGTLPYMSPEQTQGSTRDIDIRSDVYSLGVILYEMLTGAYPYPVVGHVAEVLKNIAEAPPRRPSTIVRRVGNEIETIVLKSLSKERERRYQSAENLAADIERFLRGDPIEAKRDSGWYVLRKTVGRLRVPLGVAGAFLVFGAIAVYSIGTERAKVRLAEAHEILASMVDAPSEALRRFESADEKQRTQIAAITGRYLASPAYTDRVQGARSGLWTNPNAFWASVNGGPLWANGQWLEVARVAWEAPEQIIAQLADKAQAGSWRERYVALCLLGQMAEPSNALGKICRDAVSEATRPAVISAAKWAADRLGEPTPYISKLHVRTDDVSKLVFVRIPGCEAFRRGADADDPDQWPDEKTADKPVALSSFYLSTTEVTVEAFREFFADPAGADAIGAQRAEIARVIEQAPTDKAGITPMGWVSLNAARRYCAWLTRRQAGRVPARTYRLPTEDEWEWACRGGNEGRFCYGDRAEYAGYFANCRGDREEHFAAQHMPNAYGLFDMHGGLWERCDSRYPPELVTDPAHAAPALWVIRGGANYSPALRCRSTQRNYATADAATASAGIRVVLEVDEP